MELRGEKIRLRNEASVVVAGRDVAGAAGKRGLLLVDWRFEMQGFPGRLPCDVTVRLRSCCARITCGVLGVRAPFVELGARPPGVIAASPGGQFCLGFANVAGMAAIVIVSAGDEACRAFVQRIACRASVQHKACGVLVQRKACRRLFNTKLAECLFSAKPAGACSTQNLQGVCSAQKPAERSFSAKPAERSFSAKLAERLFNTKLAECLFSAKPAERLLNTKLGVLSSAKPTGVWSVCSV